MKKRITSFVLAVLMVVSMALVFSVSAFAETPVYTITVGNAYGVPGGTATVEIFVSASEAIEGHDWLRAWQIDFSKNLRISDFNYFVNGDKPAFGKINRTGFDDSGVPTAETAGNTAMNSSDTTALESGVIKYRNCGTIEQLMEYGGKKVADLQFDIPADAVVGSEYELSITHVEVFRMEKYDGECKEIDCPELVKTVVGKVKVIDPNLDNAALKAAIAGGASNTAKKSVVVPSVFNGARVTSLVEGTDDSLLEGYYDVVTIPASVVDASDAITNISEESSIDAFVIKNPDDGAVITSIATNAKNEYVGINKVATVYYHLGTSEFYHSTFDTYDALPASSKKEISKQNLNMINLLGVYKGDGTTTYPGYFKDGQTVTLLAGITFDDTDYEELSFTVTFTEGTKYKTFTKTVKGVYKTVEGIASVDQKTAESVGAYAEGFEYLTALSINGVPTGHQYDVTVQLNGLTEDAAGALVGVCSDVATFTITL